MANHHHSHHPNHQSTAACWCCQTPQCVSHHTHTPPPHPLSPPSSSDPFLIATIVSQILQTQNPQNSPINKPTSINQNQTHHFHPHSLSSLIRRIDNLETSLNHLSSSSSSSSSHAPSYLKDAAARVIQTHFRVFLVRRSRTLRHLKHLANIKSTLTSLKSSFSPHAFVDFDALSHKAMDLLLLLDSIQGEDKMIRESKKSIAREIVQFLELIDGVCVKRHQVMTRRIKSMRLVRNDKARTGHDSRGYSEGSKGRKVDNEEKKLIANLRERVERIGKMSKALEAEEVADVESEGFEHLGDENGGTFNQIGSRYGLNIGKNRVCFVEDENVTRVYNVDGDKITAARDVEEIEDSTKGRQDEEEEEAQSDEEGSTQSSEIDGNHNHDKEFTFPAPRPEFPTRKPGVKIAG